MKKLLTVAAFALALNFLFSVAGVTFLFQSGHLDRDRVASIKAIVFPATLPVDLAAVAPTTEPATQPTLTLDDVVRQAAGRPADEQVNFLQHAFDARMAALDLRERGISDQQQLLNASQQRLERDRAALDAQKKQLALDAAQATKLASDTGFQESLQLYSVMSPKQVKTIFMTLKDDTIKQYLEAMTPRDAGRIIKEFARPDEVDRIQKVLEMMRQPSTASAVTSAAQP